MKIKLAEEPMTAIFSVVLVIGNENMQSHFPSYVLSTGNKSRNSCLDGRGICIITKKCSIKAKS